MAVIGGANLVAQNFCHTTERTNQWFAQHPELRASFERHQQVSEEIDAELYKNGYSTHNANRASAAGNFTIPVVFHILHLGGGENISDAQVKDAVSILTRDFNCANTDTSDVVVQFKNLIGNPQIDFVLATKDPNGNCTNGIIRYYDPNTDWSGGFSGYKYTWPPTRYMNVYVVRTMGDGAAGYTFLPGTGVPAAMDAIVILSNYVGSMGTGTQYTSRALTHEVGHWLNLPHVWGGNNTPGVACGNDGVSDTPITKGYSSCNLGNSKVCNPNIVENVQNYMDYAYCPRMYTIGQATRMLTALNAVTNGRNNLSSVNNLAFTGVTSPGSGCIPKLDIGAAPSFTVCSGRTLTVSSYTSNAAPSSYQWSADNSAVINNPTGMSTTVLFNNPGLTNISCTVSNANGSVSKAITIQVEDGVTQITTDHYESFEGSGIVPPSLWKIISPSNPGEKWEIIDHVGSDGSISMFAPGEVLTPNSIIILESPSFDFKHNPKAQFGFKYAYAMQNSANKDLFKVQASKNCGGSWTDVWVPSNLTLAQSSGGVTSDLYFPNAEDWKFKNVTQQPQFYPFTTEENVHIRFYFQENIGGTSSGNRFYLDELTFSSAVGINELTKAIGFNVYPNPANSDFNIGFQLSDVSTISYQVTSVTGMVLMEEKGKVYSTGTHEIKLNTGASLSAGIYFVNVEVNGVKMNKKLIVE